MELSPCCQKSTESLEIKQPGEETESSCGRETSSMVNFIASERMVVIFLSDSKAVQ